jgi:hypothetical protein
MMRLIFWVVCMAMCSGLASAQQHVSNFEACVNEAKQRHADSTTDTYSSYKCDGATAQKLVARPDECSGDAKPSLTRIERKSKPLEDGLYLRMTWRTQVCAGLCETRLYNDTRETSYLCEVRRHTGVKVSQSSSQPQRNTGRRRYANELQSQRRWADRPVRYFRRPSYHYRMLEAEEQARRMLETEEEARRMERWLDDEPQWYPPHPSYFSNEY